MNSATLIVRLDGGRRLFSPGETLTGEYWVAETTSPQVEAVEISVLWRTEGKGDEDLDVHFFERLEASDERPLDLHVPRTFSTVLPPSPLSYEGVILRIRWCVRVRLFLNRSRELLEERPFQLGSAPPARAVLRTADSP